MDNFFKILKLKLKLNFAVLSSVLLLLTCRDRSDASAKAKETSAPVSIGAPMDLVSFKQIAAPLLEVSGLSWLDHVGGSVIAVGDSEYRALVFSGKPSAAVEFKSIDLNWLKPLAGNPSSQFEGVAVDHSRLVFLLQESPGTIFVVNIATQKLVKRIDLQVPESMDIAHAWKDDPNSRGEGIILLKNGHILILKEKKPTVIMEFGPNGAQAGGYQPGMGVGLDDVFTLPAENTVSFSALKYWTIEGLLERQIADLSDLAVGPDGNIRAVSDQGGAIVSFEANLSPNSQKTSVAKVFRLPVEIKKPEGLIFGDHGRSIVGLDLHEITNNVYFLKSK